MLTVRFMFGATAGDHLKGGGSARARKRVATFVDPRPRASVRRIGTLLVDDVAYLSAGGGAVAWLAVLAVGGAAGVAPPGPLERWLAFAALVVTPLALPRVGAADRDGTVPVAYTAAVVAQPAGALCVLASALLVANGWTGPLPAVLAVGWLVVAGALAAAVLPRLLERGVRPAAETLIDLGAVYLVVGAASLVASRAGLRPLGVDAASVHLTAVHLHYAGVALPILAGCTGRLLATRNERLAFGPVAAVLGLAPVLFGVGVLGRDRFGATEPAVLGAVVLAGATLGFGLLLFGVARRTWRRADRPVPAGLLAVAGVAGAYTTVLGARYALGADPGGATVGVAAGRLHAASAAVPLALGGLLAVTLLGPPPTWRRGVPLGPRPTRHRLVTESGTDGDAEGCLSSAAALARPTFDSTRLHPEVRRVCEHTADYDLVGRRRWHAPFRLLGRVATALARRLGRPVPTGPWRAVPRVRDRTDEDPRSEARGVVWTDPETDRPVSVAAAAVHEYGDVTYANVDRPRAGGAVTTVFRPDLLAQSAGGGDGLVVHSGPGTAGDAGVYLRTTLGPVALPVRERVAVWPGAAPEAPPPPTDSNGDGPALVARREVRILGFRAFTVDYALDRAV